MPTVSDTFSLVVPQAGQTPTPRAPTLEIHSDDVSQEKNPSDEFSVRFMFTRGSGSLKAENEDITVTWSASGGSNVNSNTAPTAVTISPATTGTGDGDTVESGTISGQMPAFTNQQRTSKITLNGTVEFDY